jgi:hypothetical protein
MPGRKSRAESSFFGQKEFKVEYGDRPSPEMKLWRAVLGQIFDDAFGKTISNKSRFEKTHARDYLRHLHTDYAKICEWAGFDPWYVQRKVNEKFNSIEGGNNVKK